MEVDRQSRREKGKRVRENFLTLCLYLLGIFIIGTIIYSIFSEFNDTDHLAQAKVEINLGSEVVEAYANIQVELDGEDHCDPAPAAEWNLPSVSLPSVPYIPIRLPGFIKNCWNNCNFSPDCFLTTWKELGNAFKSAGQAVVDLVLAFLHVINCFSFLWCPITGLLLGFRDILLFTFESGRHLTCRILWALHSLFDGLRASSKCHLSKDNLDECGYQLLHEAHKKILSYDAYSEGFGFHFDPIAQKDTLIDLLFNLVVTGLVVGFFVWAERLLDSEDDINNSSKTDESSSEPESSSNSDEGSSTSTTSTSISTSGNQTPVEASGQTSKHQTSKTPKRERSSKTPKKSRSRTPKRRRTRSRSKTTKSDDKQKQKKDNTQLDRDVSEETCKLSTEPTVIMITSYVLLEVIYLYLILSAIIRF